MKRSTSLIQSVRKVATSVLPVEEKLSMPAGAFDHAVFPVAKVPDWASMRSSTEWNRRYEDMHPSDFVPVPAYDLTELTTPAYQLQQDAQEGNLRILTAKLFYSTRFFGRYSIDSGEFEGTHPGIDLKLAAGTPVSAIAGGRVYSTGLDPYLGNFVMIRHILPEGGEEIVSIYGHLEKILVTQGQFVIPGTIIGNVGSTGRSSGPHLHLQLDALASNEKGLHAAYSPSSLFEVRESSSQTINPIQFIGQYQRP
jgi:murein DD-endopeptidase MepM/ murein hydrolase activator NlpD